MSQHLEIGKFRDDTWDLQRRDKRMVRIQIRDNLESTGERDDLTLDVFLQNARQLRPHKHLPLSMKQWHLRN